MSDSFATQWIVAHHVPLSMGFPRWEYWSRLPFPSSRGSSWLRDRTRVSSIGRSYQGNLHLSFRIHKMREQDIFPKAVFRYNGLWQWIMTIHPGSPMCGQNSPVCSTDANMYQAKVKKKERKAKEMSRTRGSVVKLGQTKLERPLY